MSTIERAMKRLAEMSAQNKREGQATASANVPVASDPELPEIASAEEKIPPFVDDKAPHYTSSSFSVAAEESPAENARPLPSRPTIHPHSQIELRDWAARHGMDLGATEKRQMIECYRHIKRPLIINAEGEGRLASRFSNRIMVTSSLPDEGKTFTSLNLAISFAAERGKHVVYIDTDMVHSSLPDTLGIEVEHGIVDYLEGENLSLNDVIWGTDFPNLMILPAGRSHAYSTELLAGRNMRGLLTEIEESFESDVIVILDTPPLLASSEAATLARFVGQIVLVIEAGNTAKDDLCDALAMIDKGKLAGFVLNKYQQPGNPTAYGYYRYSA